MEWLSHLLYNKPTPRNEATRQITSENASGSQYEANENGESFAQTKKEIDFDNSLSENENYMEGIKQQLEDKNTEIQILKVKYHQLENEWKKANNKLKEESTKANKLDQKIEDKNEEIKNLKTKDKEGMKKWKKEKQDAQKNYNALFDFNKKLVLEKERLTKRNNQLEREKQYIEGYVEELKKRNNEEKQNMEEYAEGLKNRIHQMKLEKQNLETDMEKNIDSLEEQLKNQKEIFEQKFQQAQEKYKEKVINIRKKLDERGNGLRELEETNAKLREEASKYQSALGVATNIRLGDDDQNHSVKLKNDILKLQNTLENYVTHLKPNMDLNIKKIQVLAKKYGCLNEITVENPNRPFIKAILQRFVLESVFNASHELSKYRGENFALESDIEIETQGLLKSIETFSNTRVGTDEVINSAAIKIRQQVYGILGNRGFNDTIDFDGNDGTHDFISRASKGLNKIMNQFRKINDVDRKEKAEAMAPKLIQDIYKLFWFRVNVQEPIIETQFFKNDKIDSNMMKGMWNEEEVDQLCVDICYFPLVGRNLNSSNKKIYTPAKVFPRDINN